MTWEAVITRFQKYWTSAINEAHVTPSFYYDIGQEVCPQQKSGVIRTQPENTVDDEGVKAERANQGDIHLVEEASNLLTTEGYVGASVAKLSCAT